MDWREEWKTIAGSVGGTAVIIAAFWKKFVMLITWIRGQPKVKAETKVIEQQAVSGQVGDAATVNKIAVDYTNFIMVRLKRVEEQLTTEEKYSETLRLAVQEKDAINHSLKEEIVSIKEKLKQLGQELHDCLQMKDCDSAIKKIIIKYGL